MTEEHHTIEPASPTSSAGQQIGPGKPIGFALTLGAYGLCVVGIGGLTYLAAPPEANAATALVVTAVAATLALVVAIGSLLAPPGRVASFVVIHIGLLLPVLIIGGTAPRAASTLRALDGEREVIAAEDAQHTGDRGYQAVGLGAVSAVSLFAVVALAAHRPKPASRR